MSDGVAYVDRVSLSSCGKVSKDWGRREGGGGEEGGGREEGGGEGGGGGREGGGRGEGGGRRGGRVETRE